MPDVGELQVTAPEAAMGDDGQVVVGDMHGAVGLKRHEAKESSSELEVGLGADHAQEVLRTARTASRPPALTFQNPASLPPSEEEWRAEWDSNPRFQPAKEAQKLTLGAETTRFSPTKLPLLFQPTRRKVRSRLNLSNSPLTVRLAVTPASLAISSAWGAVMAGYVLLALYALGIWVPS